MKTTTNFLCCVLLIIMVGFNTSCSDDEYSYVEALIVASETVATDEGTAYWVKRNGNSNWEMMYTGIYNFNYEKGYEYKIIVRFYKNDNAGADQSSHSCHLLNIISKEKKNSEVPLFHKE